MFIDIVNLLDSFKPREALICRANHIPIYVTVEDHVSCISHDIRDYKTCNPVFKIDSFELEISVSNRGDSRLELG